jgi:outer membrane protein insertion porin family
MKQLMMTTWILLIAQMAAAKNFTFIVEGADANNARTAKEIIGKRLTNNYTLEQLQETLNAIFATGQYSDGEVDLDEKGDRTEVIFKLTPLRIIQTIHFRGNNNFSAVDLLAELGIAEGEGYSADKVRYAVENIKKYYNLNGYLNAQVEGQFSQASAGGLTFDIVINEGSPCLIQKIEIKSVNHNLDRIFESFSRKKAGDTFTQSELTSLQNDLTNDLFKNHFYGASLAAPEIIYNDLKTRVTITYVVNDPYAYVLVFEGNISFTEAKIRKELNLEAATRLSSAPVDDLTDRISRFYKKAGYADVALKTKENLFAQDFTRRITFIIVEGARVKIKDIHMEGNFSRPEKFYKDFLFDRSGDIIYGHIYDAEEFENGVKNLVTDLQNQGFIAAKVLGTRVDFSKRRDTVTITLVFDEGPQTFINQVQFVNNKSISNSELEDTIGIKDGTPLQLSSVEESVAKIVDLYKSRGYLEARVVNQGKAIISYSPDNTKAALTYQLDEGPQIVVAAIIIDGNSFTKDVVIRRELQFHPGDVLTPDKLEYSEKRLQALRFFSQVDIRTLDSEPNEGHRTVLVHVEESNPGLFRGGVGINNDEGFTIKGYVGADYRNLFGTGRGVRARVELADRTQYQLLENEITLGYTEPFLFNTENTGQVNFIKSRRLYTVTNVLQSGQTSNQQPPYVYAIDNTQVDTLLERDLTPQLKLIYETYGIAHINYFEINNKVAAAPIDISTTGPRFILDRRNDPFNPTRGDLSNLGVEFSSPYLGSTQTVSYYKVTASYTKYISLGNVIFANEGRGGYINNLSTLPNGGIPALKAFFLGGESTLRAFNPVTESVPSSLAFPSVNNIPSVPTDSVMLLAKSEIRFPIYGNFGGALFYDGGAVTLPGYYPGYAQPYFWRDDVGIGLRYNTPFGPVSLEYAAKLNRNESAGESAGQVLFSIGVF